MPGVASQSLTFEGDFQKNLAELPTKSKAAILAIMTQEASKLEQYMKANRPWTDRTGAAKAGLIAQVSYENDDELQIYLSHSVYYGVYLEYAMEKRFAIIYPTILTQGPEVINAFNNAMSRLVRGA